MAQVRQTDGSIGFAELILAVQNQCQIGVVKNKAGRYTSANLHSIQEAARSRVKDAPEDLRYSLIDPAGADAYPICGTTWAMVHVDPPSRKGQAIYDFLWWVTHDGQSMCETLNYAPLPQELIPLVEKQLAKIKN
jgi:phosphate transport system substrate-binding protein